MYTYLILHLFTILFPLGYSFETKIAYYKKWKYLFISIFLVAAFFVTWDYIFTLKGIWSFNEKYVIGLFIAGLPLEEWMFFITVPFSCVFIYESLNYFIKKDYLIKYADAITAVVVLSLITIGLFNTDKLYTVVTFILTSVALIAHRMYLGNIYLGRFYVAYLVHLIPFFIVNGILTYLPVVRYNDFENLGIRMGTIPVEDAVYSMLMLLLNISIYEVLKRKFIPSGADEKKLALNKKSYAGIENNHR